MRQNQHLNNQNNTSLEGGVTIKVKKQKYVVKQYNAS